MNRFQNTACIALLLAASSAFAQSEFTDGNFTKKDLQEKRLIDKGDGKARWMTRADAMKLAEKAHADQRCGGFFDITDQIVVDSQPLPMVESFRLDLNDRNFSQQKYLEASLPMLDIQRIFGTVTSLSAFKNRFYKSSYGVKSAEWIASQFKGIAKNRNDVRVELFKHSWAQPSVIATIPGQGPKANEIVIIGGHEDSINQSAMGSGEQVAPGADDNASGVGTVLEVFRVLVETGFKPNRTLLFMTYSGEEAGLLGSQDIANRFKKDKRAVVGVIQFDMTAFVGSGDQVVFITDFTNPELTTYTQKLMDTYVKAKWSNDKCGYACSDHASWTKAGYFSVMPFEAKMGQDNKDIHTARDVISKLDFHHGLHFAKLGLSFMAELAQ